MRDASSWLWVVLLSGYAAAAPVETKGATAVTQPYSLRVALKPGELRAGAPLFVEVTLRNLSRSTARIGQSSLLFDWRYELTWQDGAPVAMTRYGTEGRRSAESGTPGAILRTLAPGEELKAEVPLHRIFDLSISGRYRLVVSRQLPPPEGGAWIEVRSEPLAFTLGD
jgi:hypothetical protein